MHILRGALAVTVTALWLVFGVSAPAAQTGRPKVALVTVVADASGPLRDLTAKDFLVTEDNQKRDVVEAEIARDPLAIALLVDTSQPPMGVTAPVQDLRTAVSTFVKTIQSGSLGAKIAMAEFAGASVPKTGFEARPEDLAAAIGRLYPGQQPHAVLIEALVDAAKRLGEQPPPRRAIVSVDFNSQEASADRTMKEAVEAVHKAGATLWSVSVRGTAPSPDNREEVLNKITKANGGLRLTPVGASGLEPNLKIVANSLLSQYTVTFMRPEGASPKVTKFETTKGTKVQLTPWMR